MTDHITPAEVARLRELLEARLRADETARRNPCVYECMAALGVTTERLATVAIELLPALLSQLDAQAAEIERLSKGFHESCIAREEAANARANKAEKRVRELEALLRSVSNLIPSNDDEYRTTLIPEEIVAAIAAALAPPTAAGAAGGEVAP